MTSAALLATVTRRLRPHRPGWPASLGPILAHGKSVRLRPPRGTDSTEWVKATREDQSQLEPWWPTSSLAWQQRCTEQAWAERYRRALRAARRGSMIPMVIEVNGEFAGEMALDRIDHQNGVAELGGWVRSTYTGSSVAGQALRQLVHHAFSQAALRRLIAPVGVGNRAAAFLLARNGFRQEGVLRAHMHVGGGLLDHQLWALLAQDITWTPALQEWGS